MNRATPIFRALLAGSFCMLLQSCAPVMPDLKADGWKQFFPDSEGEGWKQFAAAADAQSKRSGAVNLQFAWEIPKQRLLMLARLNEERMVLYQIDHRAGLKPGDIAKQVNCYFEKNSLYCAGPGEAAPSLVAESGPGLWMKVEAHAAKQIQKLNAHAQASLQAQLTKPQPGPRLDLTRQRHPFEWGGEYETVENAQAFLEAVTAQGTRFRSLWPKAPWLGSQGNEWLNQDDQLTFKTTERCVSLASSASRTAKHYNHDFWAAETVAFQTVYRWQQPIDWRSIGGVSMESDGVFFHGRYSGSFQGQGLTYVSGWSPDILTANASTFDPSKYSVAAWNVRLLLHEAGGLRERVLYAVTYLDIMCRKR
ncbi:hypothetical protein Q8A64_10920 [Oxalobacteraceae bacterium R-40]|uniref:Lipoprotein n=1 Tax=Keguizhuia sedimenti TaxID=3064264 RepID=A0ABU1BPS3_9BURK|nr:hypothetical protein [Oxalobacteraceae bacterium R-40]